MQFVIIALVANIFVEPFIASRNSLKAVEEGDLTQGGSVNTRDEIGELQSSFNAMLSTLNRIIANVDYCDVHMGQSA